MQPGDARPPSTTDEGRLVPAEEDAGSEVSGWELREREEEGRAEAEALGVGEVQPLVPSHTLIHGIRRRELGGGGDFPLSSLWQFPMSFPVRFGTGLGFRWDRIEFTAVCPDTRAFKKLLQC